MHEIKYDGYRTLVAGGGAAAKAYTRSCLDGSYRFALSLQESATSAAVLRKPDVYVAPLGPGMNAEGVRLARDLRRHDLVVELGDESFRLKKSFESATKVGAKYILIVGENEVKADAFALKDLATGEQVSVARADLTRRIQGN